LTPRCITAWRRRPARRGRFDKLNKALRDALASDEVKRQLTADGTEITPGTPEDYADFIDKDAKKWSELVKASGVEQE
jgi:tripartite-type tricarboxylate transporter receptor subunit TctC